MFNLFSVTGIILSLLAGNIGVLPNFNPVEKVPLLAEDSADVAKDEIDQDWLAQTKSQIAEQEYLPTLQTSDTEEQGWHFANRANNFRSYIGSNGWEMSPRTRDIVSEKQAEPGAEPAQDIQKDVLPNWYWQYKLNSFGREDQLIGLNNQPKINEKDQTVTLDYGNLKEWYKNLPEGMEQGFTLEKKPAGTGLLVLGGEVKTDLNISSASQEQVTFSTDQQDIFKFHKLIAIDSQGKTLPAYLKTEQKSNHIALNIIVDDTHAIYPIVVDPLATSAAWTGESNQADSYFGNSADTAGDVNGDGYSDVIIGAYYYDNGQADEGKVYVYHGSATGLSVTADWTAEGNQATAYFGQSVTTAGDVNGDGYSDVIIGAYYYDNGEADEGMVYVYFGSATGLSDTADWTAESDQAAANFGYSVATAGDVNGDGYSDVIIGATGYDNGEANEGRAYVYLGSATGLSDTADWTAESDQAGAAFGVSVATAGDVNGDGYSDVIVGAFTHDNGQADEGRAFVYHGSVSGLSATSDWTAESDQASAYFGISVATAGDVNGDGYSDVIVGSYAYDNGQADEGRAFVYHGSATGLSDAADWTAEADQAASFFGISTASAGDVNGDGYSDVIVGAYYIDNDQVNEGRAYVYHGSASGLSVTADWTAESDQVTSWYGLPVASAGDVNGDGYSDVIVGATSYDNGQSDEGRAFVYYGSASGPSATADWTAEADQATSRYGEFVASAGDVNGDGYSDVIVGAKYFDNGEDNEGKAFLYFGSASGPSATADWTAEGDQATAYFGTAVATAGDVNGDGYSDVIVGASSYDSGELDEGKVFLYYGSATGPSVAADWTAESNRVSAYYGTKVASAGDVNGDGYSDVIVGDNFWEVGIVGDVCVFVYYGSASGPSVIADWTAEADQAANQFGYKVATAGDVNGDGYSDVIVGAFKHDNGETDEGRAFVYHGSATGLSSTADWIAEGDQISSGYGRSVASAGDVNGDGYSDVIVGAYLYDNGESNEGRAFVYHGSASGLSDTADWTAESDQISAWFGYCVATAGDVNGDGYSDVIVGAYMYDNGESNEGKADVYFGSATGLADAVGWTADSDQASASFGADTATAGDVNGDGYSDVIVGAYFYDNGQADEGKVFLYYGNATSGLAIAPRQLKANNTPLDILSQSNDKNSAKIKLFGRTPMGRTKAKIWYEVKPLGTLMNGTSLRQASSWTDIGVAGTDLTQTMSSLVSGTNYAWRARIQYFPFMNFSPWYSVGTLGLNQTDFKTAFPDIQFRLNQSTGYKIDSPVTFNVDLSEVAGMPAVIDYAAGGGTATGGGVDYTLTSGTLTIPVGQTNGQVSMSVVNDNTVTEPNETLTVTLSNALNSTLGNNSTHTYTIFGTTIEGGSSVVPPTSTPTPTPTQEQTPASAQTPVQEQTPTPTTATLLSNLTSLGISLNSLVKLPDDGNLETQEDSAVYFIGKDGKRHAFPNSKVYLTWYSNFDGITLISNENLATIPLGSNARYKPGTRMIKFATDPKVYAIDTHGILRWIKTEDTVKQLYGDAWNTKIDDMSDAFFGSYFFGTDINSSTDYNPEGAMSSVGTVSDDYGW